MSLADLLPGQNAEEVRDHWWWRPGWRIGRRFYAFHVTFDGQQELYHLAETYRRTLTDLPVTLVPDRWLHLTMQGIGFADQLAAADVRRVAQRVGDELEGIPGFTVEFGEIVVADEAIAMPAEPAGLVRHLRGAVRTAIGAVLGDDQVSEDAERYRPHVSIAYIKADGPADPYIAALKAAHPAPVRVRIGHVGLIEMHRDHQMYEWTTTAALPLG